MQRDPGKEAEYKRRHDEIWPELAGLLRSAGVTNYSIHLDHEIFALFGYLQRIEPHRLPALAADPVLYRWWQSMRTDEIGTPIFTEIAEMFHMT